MHLLKKPRYRRILCGIVLWGGLLSGSNAFAQDDRPVPLSDSDRTLFARDLFYADPQLRSRNLGVRIEGPNAELWGTVTHRDQSILAERIVLTVPGVRKVRNECQVVAKPDPAVELVGKLVRGEVTADWLPNEPQPLVAAPPIRPAPKSPVQSVSQRKPIRPAVQQAEPMVSSVSLFPPQEMVMTSQPVPMIEKAPLEDLPTRLNRILRSDARFANLAIQMTDTDIRITGTVSRASYVWDVADELATAAEGRRIDVTRIVSTGR